VIIPEEWIGNEWEVQELTLTHFNINSFRKRIKQQRRVRNNNENCGEGKPEEGTPKRGVVSCLKLCPCVSSGESELTAMSRMSATLEKVSRTA
jgi:hypothetical protein